MKTNLIRVFLIVAGSLLLMHGLTMAQPEQTTAVNPPLEQPLIREGDLAVKLVEALKLGTPENETEAESILASVDITPRNGWIADYPVTPDIVDELQSAVGEAAESGKIAVNKETSQKTFQAVVNDFDLFVKADTSGRAADETASPGYPDSTAENNYYYDEGPPVVTYYAPPPDYAYLYAWVPDPFWWSDVWFPGFFILGDFDVDVDRHRHRHDHDRDHGKHISNHFADPKTGRTFRIDPAGRSHGRTFSDMAGAVGSRPSAESGARAILNTSRGSAATGAYREFRGYGASGPPTGTRSGAFENSPNSQFEKNSSDRGFQSRSNAGLTSGSGRGSAGGSRGGGGTGFHGGGGGGAGFHGGGGGGGGMRR